MPSDASTSTPAFAARISGPRRFRRGLSELDWGDDPGFDFDYSQEGRFRGSLVMDDKLVFEIEMPRGGDTERPESPMLGYTYIEGIPHAVESTQRAYQMGAGGGKDVEIKLGDHPISEDLRSLGLPKKSLMTTWIGKMVMRFGAPEKL